MDLWNHSTRSILSIETKNRDRSNGHDWSMLVQIHV
jgi:hypothetical protein